MAARIVLVMRCDIPLLRNVVIVRLLGVYHPSPGISDQRFGIHLADTAERVADANPNEVERLEWVPVDRVRDFLRAGEVDGLSLTSLLWALADG